MNMQIPEIVAQGQDDWAFSVGVQAYIWGLPIVKCWKDRLEKMQSASGASDDLIINEYRHVRDLASADAAEFVNAATDFLYSTAVIDLSNGPLRLTSPDFNGRWYGLQVLDAYMDTISNLGTRTFGDQLPTVILAKQGQEVNVAEGEHIVYSDSEFLYIVGRFAAENKLEDLALVHALQDGLHISRVVGDSPLNVPAKDSWRPLENSSDCPEELSFFTELGQVLKFVPPKASETALANLFKDVGLSVENGFEVSALPESVKTGLARAAALGQSILDAKIFEVGEFINGWSLVRDIGEYHGNYIVRALVSIHGIWANVPKEAMYFMARTDSVGEILNGSNYYEIRFADGVLPPVDAFWSISYYDAQGRLVKNRIDRYTINSLYSQLKPNEDGSISVFIGQESNDSEMESNWLPSHEGQFNLNFRCYNAKEALLSGEYQLPTIIKR